MGDVERQFRRWVDLIDHLLSRPGASFPIAQVRSELAATFGTNASWNWVGPNYDCGFEMLEQPADWPTLEEHRLMVHLMRLHPLIRWFEATQSSVAMTVGRVPTRIAPRRDVDRMTHFMRPVGIDQQLAIPYEFEGPAQCTFVLATSGTDYTDDQLELARRIQPLLVLLARHHQLLDRCDATAGRTADLTPREIVVLRLLADGLTAQAIGRRLGVSPLTVRKHLENTYRKLGVSDRMLAVLQARQLGLLDTDPSAAAANGAGGPATVSSPAPR